MSSKRYQKCPVCRVLKTFAGPMCPGCEPYFEVNAEGKAVRKVTPSALPARYHVAMIKRTEYPYNGTKFKPEELILMRNFIVAYDHLPLGEFELKVNRMFIDDPNKPKNYVAIMELLTVCNTACYSNTIEKEVPMSTKNETVAPAVNTEANTQADLNQLATVLNNEVRVQPHLETIVEGALNPAIEHMPPSKTPDSIAIGNQVKAHREHMGLKREALATQLGLSVGYLGLIENGGPTWVSEKLVGSFAAIGLTFDPTMLASKNAAAKLYDKAAAVRAKANKAKAERKVARAKKAKKAKAA